MARNTEPRVNAALAEALDGKHPRWQVRAERTDIFAGRSALQPDIVVNLTGTAPIILEAEFVPATNVEDEARDRLGKIVKDTGFAIEQVIALKYAEDLRVTDDWKAAIGSTALEWCVLSGDQDVHKRLPEQGWFCGSLDDLAAAIELVSLSERLVAQGLTILEDGVRHAANILRSDALPNYRDGLDKMAALLHQEDGEQTSRMAMAIIANAMTFHTTLAGRHGIPQLDSLRGPSGRITRHKLIGCWRKILEINYWPIFNIAIDLLLTIRDAAALHIMDRLAAVAHELAVIGASSLNDLSGRMFQRLIADRKFLATFYTLPNSAALLAELAIPELDVDWQDASAIKALRIGDLACGTGGLLLAAYHGVLSRYRRTGRDDSALHATMMERALLAADIMPAATHLTASNLSGTHPSVTFENTSVYTMPYGRQPEKRGHAVAIGSLDLLDAGHDALALFGTGQRQARGDQEDVDVHVDIQHGTLDLAIMNPPFTRSTNHEAKAAGVPIPSFAGFGTPKDEQREMAARLRAIRQRMDAKVGHGNAGLASHFLHLADVKTRPGGAIALVLPSAFVQGDSWKAARRLIETGYKNILVVAIAATGSTSRAFSADTGMAEILLVAKKKRPGESVDGTTLFANLTRRPRSLLEANEAARAIRNRDDRSESGWLNAVGGSYLRGTLTEGGAVGVLNPGLATVMRGLATGRLQLPRYEGSLSIPMTLLAELGNRGPYHLDIRGWTPQGEPRGPFDIVALPDAEQPPTYPALWAHDAPRERRLVVAPDSAGRVRPGCREMAISTWNEAASRLHFNLDFRLNSQSLAACLTPEPAIGGRAWPSFLLKQPKADRVIVLGANTTLGLMSFWWLGSRQQQGRALLTVSLLPELRVLDPRQLTDQQISRAADIFDRFKDRSLLPANEAYRDPVRADLDRAVLVELLGLPESILRPLKLLRDQWCAEPSVHGGKATRIIPT